MVNGGQVTSEIEATNEPTDGIRGRTNHESHTWGVAAFFQNLISRLTYVHFAATGLEPCGKDIHTIKLT